MKTSIMAKQKIMTEEDVIKAYGGSHNNPNREEVEWYWCKMCEDGERIMRTYQNQYKHKREELAVRWAKRVTLLVREASLLVDEVDKEFAIAEKDLAIAEKNLAIVEKDLAIAKNKLILAKEKLAFAEDDLTFPEKNSPLAELKVTFAEDNLTFAEIELPLAKLELAVAQKNISTFADLLTEIDASAAKLQEKKLL